MIQPGQEWGRPASGPADVDVAGTDADLAATVRAHAGALVRFRPTTSDIARAVGAGRGDPGPPTTELPLDALRLPDGTVAVNMVVFGTPPDRLRYSSRVAGVTVRDGDRQIYRGAATTVVVAVGQFLRGLDVVPRGHPGDGRCEVQVYAVPRGQRRALRSRLGTGAHVPHPAIAQRSARGPVTVSMPGLRTLEVDGRRIPAAAFGPVVVIDLVADAFRMLV